MEEPLSPEKSEIHTWVYLLLSPSASLYINPAYTYVQKPLPDILRFSLVLSPIGFLFCSELSQLYEERLLKTASQAAVG